MTRTLTTRRTLSVAGAALGLAFAGAAVPLVSQAATTDTGTGTTTLSEQQLTEMREEERLARDVYTALADATGSSVFTRIASSEQRHMDAVERLMEVRGMDADAAGDTAGDYAVDSFDDLYDTWVAEGKTSTDAAYGVGITIEKQDIADLKALPDNLDATVQRVVSALLAGSERHLAAFTAASEGQAVGDGVCNPGTGLGMGSGAGHGRWADGTADDTGTGFGRTGGMMGGRGPAWAQDE